MNVVPPQVSARPRPAAALLRMTYPRILLLVFFVSLPFANPVVHGDGVGYYAYARAPLIQRDLHFEADWKRANLNFSLSRTRSDGEVDPGQYTPTGHIANPFAVGPAILWSPFLLVTHAGVLIVDALGGKVPADGFSAPYLVAMALGTAVWGFLGLWFSFLMARKFTSEKWAFLATLGIWFATALPVYMYFNPSWSHAHSVFAVALFLWYWDRTRTSRTFPQWIALGLIGGLMLDVYFPNGVFFLLPLLDAIRSYVRGLRPLAATVLLRELACNSVFLAAITLSFLPTLITRRIVFGGILRFGTYSAIAWQWDAPFWRQVLFSSDHGLLSWTPVLSIAVVGLAFGLFARPLRGLSSSLLLVSLAFYYLFSSDPYWDGMSSFGNRFFLSLTPIFIFGLALLFHRLHLQLQSSTRLFPAASAFLFLLVLWNAGLIYQWGTHLIPARGPVSFREIAHNQFLLVPRQLRSQLHAYFFRRSDLMRQIEQRDIDQLNGATPSN